MSVPATITMMLASLFLFIAEAGQAAHAVLSAMAAIGAFLAGVSSFCQLLRGLYKDGAHTRAIVVVVTIRRAVAARLGRLRGR